LVSVRADQYPKVATSAEKILAEVRRWVARLRSRRSRVTMLKMGVCISCKIKIFRITPPSSPRGTFVEQRLEALDAAPTTTCGSPFVLPELLARARGLIRRGIHKGHVPLRYADLKLDQRRRRAKRGKQRIPLNVQEVRYSRTFSSACRRPGNAQRHFRACLGTSRR
jgi:hypothetical protein